MRDRTIAATGIALALALLSSACSPMIPDGEIYCRDSEQTCPEGYVCGSDRRCHFGDDAGTAVDNHGGACTDDTQCLRAADRCVAGACLEPCIGGGTSTCSGTELCAPAPRGTSASNVCLRPCPDGLDCEPNFYCRTGMMMMGSGLPPPCFPIAWP